MHTYYRTCRKRYEITAQNGDHFELNRGDRVLTSDVNKNGEVTVFKSFWVPVPLSYFKRAYERFT